MRYLGRHLGQHRWLQVIHEVADRGSGMIHLDACHACQRDPSPASTEQLTVTQVTLAMRCLAIWCSACPRADRAQGYSGGRCRQARRADLGNPYRGSRGVDTYACTRKDCDLAGRGEDGCEGEGADKGRRGERQAGDAEGKGQDGKGCERRVQGGVSKQGSFTQVSLDTMVPWGVAWSQIEYGSHLVSHMLPRLVVQPC